MIIVKLCGGLGNQMFQYAIGRHLSVLKKTRLLLDLSPYGMDGHRSYMMHYLNISAAIATPSDLAKFESPPFYCKLLLQKFRKIHQKERSFDPSILHAKGHLYLDGYWQTERYFAPIKEILREEFSLKSHHLVDNGLLTQMRSSNSVALHIRRGDYVTNQNANLHHGLLRLSYYEEAIQFVMSRQKDPIFFIFSDDKEWVQRNLHLDVNHIIVDTDSPPSDLGEFFLMSNCKHFVIANSTYSWWAAWLSQHQGKIVVAPQPWFASAVKNDIVPDSWHKLNVEYGVF